MTYQKVLHCLLYEHWTILNIKRLEDQLVIAITYYINVFPLSSQLSVVASVLSVIIFLLIISGAYSKGFILTDEVNAPCCSVDEARVHEGPLTTYRGPARPPPPPSPAPPSPRAGYLCRRTRQYHIQYTWVCTIYMYGLLEIYKRLNKKKKDKLSAE